jgi:hypothetical protein
MNRVFPIALALSFCLVAAGWADDKNDARAIVVRAVQAQGGEALLSRARSVQLKTKGSILGSRYAGETFEQLPNQYKIVFEIDGPDERIRMTMVLNRNKAWTRTGQEQVEEDANSRLELIQVAYIDYVGSLLPLLREKEYALAPLGDAVVYMQPAVGVAVTSKGHPDVKLYFAKNTGLLIKVACRFKDPASNKDQLLEQHYSEYEEVDSASASEQVLAKAQISTDTAGLLDFLRKRTSDESKRGKAKPLIRDLGNAEFETREKAERGLLALGEAALPALSEAVNDADPEIASRAKDLLKKIGKAKATDPAVLDAAIRVVAYRKPEGAAEALLAFLPSAPNEEVRQEIQAALAAVAMRDGKPDKALTAALSDNDPLRRAAATAALGQDAGPGKEKVSHRIFLPGLKMPVKGTDYRDEKPERSWEITEIKFYDRFPESMFARPK